MEDYSSTLEKLHPDLRNFCRLLACFGCPMVPVDLFTRACRSKPTWSSNGELVQKSSAGSGIPAWFRDHFNPNIAFHDHQEPIWLLSVQTLGIIELVSESGIQYLKLTREYRAHICNDITLDDRRTLFSECTAIVIHAFPCKYAELLGEDMEIRLLDVVESSILPLLAVVTDDDIMNWISPREQ
jgi:hypothetical protein